MMSSSCWNSLISRAALAEEASLRVRGPEVADSSPPPLPPRPRCWDGLVLYPGRNPSAPSQVRVSRPGACPEQLFSRRDVELLLRLKHKLPKEFFLYTTFTVKLKKDVERLRF